MSPSEIPDRRPLLYLIMGVVILAIAAVLFWPQDRASLPPNMVLTPESVRQANAMETPLEGTQGIEDADDETSEKATETETVPQDQFTVTDAKLDVVESKPKPAETPKAPTKTNTQTTKPTAKSTSTPTLAQPSSRGDYLIYVGSFSDQANAQKEASRLSNQGIRAHVASSGSTYRVAVGYFKVRSQAEAYGQDLKRRLKLDFWISTR